MNTKTLAGALTAGVLVFGGIYAGGVALTGLKVDDLLSDLDSTVHSSSYTQSLFENDNVIFVKHDSSFFKETGVVLIEGDARTLRLPVEIEKGFLNASVSIDGNAFKEAFLSKSNMPLDKDSASFEIRGSYSALRRKANVSFRGHSDYVGNSFRPFDIDFTSTIEDSGAGDFKVYITNCHFYDDVHVGSLKFTSNFKPESDFVIFDTTELNAREFKADNFYIGSLDFMMASENVDDSGSFDLNIKANGESLLDYINNYNIDLTVGRLNVHALEESRGDKQKLLEALLNASYLKINHLDGNPGEVLGSYFGIKDPDKLNLTSEGQFDFIGVYIFKKIRGNLVIKADKKPDDNGMLFVEKNGEYVCELTVKDTKIFINGNRFL